MSDECFVAIIHMNIDHTPVKNEVYSSTLTIDTQISAM